MAKPRQPPHILLIPFPAQGHIIPFLDFSHHLSLQNFSLTIVVTPSNLPLLSPLLSVSPSIKTLSLPFPSSPHLPPNVENSKDLPPSSMALFIHALAGLYSPLLSWIKSHTDSDNPVSAIVSDFFLGWTQPLAKEIGVPRIVFSCSTVFGTAVLHSLFPRLPQTHDLNLVSFPEIPGSPVFPLRELTYLYRSYKEGDPVSEAVRQNFLWNLESWGFVSFTFKELEGVYLEHPLADLGFRKIWAVGPLTPINRGINRGGVRSVSASEVVTWLDRWDEESVVYISFGSQAVLPRMQATLLATALEKSGVHFVWAMSDSYSNILPEGFEERIAVSGKGMIIKGWAPQVAILSHSSVGWFLTHCGVNSILEALTAGVAMLAWPMAADQFVNAKLLVESAGVAIPVYVASQLSTSSEQEEELAKVFKETVALKGTEVQNRAKEMARKASQAVREGGSSYQELQELVQQLWKLEVN